MHSRPSELISCNSTALDLQQCGISNRGALAFQALLRCNKSLAVLDLRINPLIGKTNIRAFSVHDKLDRDPQMKYTAVVKHGVCIISYQFAVLISYSKLKLLLVDLTYNWSFWFNIAAVDYGIGGDNMKISCPVLNGLMYSILVRDLDHVAQYSLYFLFKERNLITSITQHVLVNAGRGETEVRIRRPLNICLQYQLSFVKYQTILTVRILQYPYSMLGLVFKEQVLLEIN